ncbi:MAG: cyclomaltodextrinase C-terminal domain-containing protein, partial [Chitinophagaceae bacterium]
LANFRKQSSALKGGRLMQFVPEDGVYTYFRYNKEQTIMVVMNTSAEERTIDPQRYKERVMVNQELKDIMDGTTRTVSSTWKLPPHGIWIMEVIQR